MNKERLQTLARLAKTPPRSPRETLADLSSARMLDKGRADLLGINGNTTITPAGSGHTSGNSQGWTPEVQSM
jgi:hypothetical protein